MSKPDHLDRRRFFKKSAFLSSLFLAPRLLLGNIERKNEKSYKTLGLWDDGFKIGRVRTDFNSPTKGTEENPLTLTACHFAGDDPYLITAGASWGMRGCKTTPVAFENSNSYTNGEDWPKNNFWVLSVNNEPAYSTDFNSGPPDQSLPISKPGKGIIGLDIVKDGESGSCEAIMDLDHAFVKEEGAEGMIPFLSIGADSNRGNGQLITLLNPENKDVKQKIQFTVRMDAVRNMVVNKTAGMFWFIVSAKWEGIYRMVFVPLYYFHGLEKPEDRKMVNHGHWNWNIEESFFYPGGDLIYFQPEGLKANGMPIEEITEVGKEYTYTIDIQRIFELASKNSYGKSFDIPLPKDRKDIPVTGIHWAAEMYGPNARLAFTLKSMEML